MGCFVFFVDTIVCINLHLWSIHLASTLTLLVNIVSIKTTAAAVKVSIVYNSSRSAGFDPFWFNGGFAGRLGRLVKAKQILDEQVFDDSVY